MTSLLRWEGIYKEILGAVKNTGGTISPSRGPARELICKTFHVPTGRDRCLMNETRNFEIFQAVGHWLWIMAGRADLPAIKHYNPRVTRFSADQRKLDGAYGPRLFGLGVLNQIPHAIEVIRGKGGKIRDTRRAVATVYIPEFDSHRTIVEDREDEVPCTLALQFLPRGGKLQMATYMRSQDALFVLPYDVFVFTLIQEYVAVSCGLEVGEYHHVAGSFHAYEKDAVFLESVLRDEAGPGPFMPAMPGEQPAKYLGDVLSLEERIRSDCEARLRLPGRERYKPRDFLHEARDLPDFWRSVIHCLIAVAALRLKDRGALGAVLQQAAPPFDRYLRRAIDHLSQQRGDSLESFDAGK